MKVPNRLFEGAGVTYRVRAGSGGAHVSVSGINGNIQLGRVWLALAFENNFRNTTCHQDSVAKIIFVITKVVLQE